MKINYKQYGLYLLRWQMSTPILAGCLMVLKSVNNLTSTIIANLIGGLIFFWVDKFIFTSKTLLAQWQVEENIQCFDCGKTARGYRLVKTANYDRTKSDPQFRCEHCSQAKAEKLRLAGVKI
jgi:DNA-directed RNA polymerase subunit RPC12/RpoP